MRYLLKVVCSDDDEMISIHDTPGGSDGVVCAAEELFENVDSVVDGMPFSINIGIFGDDGRFVRWVLVRDLVSDMEKTISIADRLHRGMRSCNQDKSAASEMHARMGRGRGSGIEFHNREESEDE